MISRCSLEDPCAFTRWQKGNLILCGPCHQFVSSLTMISELCVFRVELKRLKPVDIRLILDLCPTWKLKA